jgi:bifunctional oligoribonuclease and PAP phosphatase NrnA
MWSNGMFDILPEVKTLLHTSRRILITSHLHPDGDAAGSMTGLCTSLRENGASVDLALATDVGISFSYLFEKEQILNPNQVEGPYDIAIILDIGSEDRTGFPEVIRGLGCPVINIDHHATNYGFADFDLLDTSATSTCEMIYFLIAGTGLPLSRDTASRLYLGMLTDSRHFQNANVHPGTFQAAQALLKTGFDHQPIIRRLTQSRTPLDLKMLGYGLSAFKTRCESRIAYVLIRKRDLEKIGANYRHAWSSGLFGHLISLGSAMVSVTFIEADNNLVFCEFRSKDGFDVSEAAVHFGGGGHRSAAGCSKDIAIDSFADDVLTFLEKRLKTFLSESFS